MRKRNAKGNCNVQTLALEIITPLNECTEILSRVSTGHKQNRRGMQKKGKRKIQWEVPQSQTAALPFPDTKRKRKQTNQTRANRTNVQKSTKITSLFPKRGIRNAKKD